MAERIQNHCQRNCCKTVSFNGRFVVLGTLSVLGNCYLTSFKALYQVLCDEKHHNPCVSEISKQQCK